MRSVASSNACQSVSEALNIINDAKIKNNTLGVTANGDIEIIYKNEDKNNQFINQKIVYAVLNKIGNESKLLFNQDKNKFDECIFLLQEKVPGLQEFIVQGKFQILHKSWDSWLKISHIPTPGEIKKREKLILDLEKLIPIGLKIEKDKNFIATMTHFYSEKTIKLILDDFKNLEQQKLDSKTQIDPQFQSDANRCNFNFISNGKKLSFGLGKKEKVIDALINFCGGNVKLAGTLSKLLSQTAIAPLVNAEYSDIQWGRDGSPIVLEDKTQPEKLEYTLTREKNGDILFSFLGLKKSTQIQNPSTGKTYKINQGKAYSGEPSQQNFAVRSLLSIRLKQTDLDQNIIDPAVIQPPQITYCISLSDETLSP